MVGLGYSLIPEKLVTKIKTGQFIDLANLYPKSPGDSAPNVFPVDGKLLVRSAKKRVPRNYRHSYMGGGIHCLLVDLVQRSSISMAGHYDISEGCCCFRLG